MSCGPTAACGRSTTTVRSEAKAASREYVFEMDEPPGSPPLLAIIGGKITTYRRLAEAALERLAPAPAGADRYSPPGWTGPAPLPGGEFDLDGFERLAADLARDYPFLQAGPRASPRARLRQGGLAHARQSDIRRRSRPTFGATLTEAEVRYLIEQEWARTAEDVVWRRSKLGLRLTPAEIAALDAWMRELPRALQPSDR